MLALIATKSLRSRQWHIHQISSRMLVSALALVLYRLLTTKNKLEITNVKILIDVLCLMRLRKTKSMK